MYNPFVAKKFDSGASLDNRPVEKRQRDYNFKETVASADQVNWVKKDPKEWRKFPIFDQNGSGSCVAQTTAKLLGINYWLRNNGQYVHFSATDIYQRRSNKPDGGMIGIEALDIATKGVTLEALVPSQKLTDAQMDAVIIEDYKKRVGELFKAENYLTVPTKDIETIASIIQRTGKGVMVWFYFTRKEWNDAPELGGTYGLTDERVVRHSVTAVDFAIYKGKKGIIIDDSWGDTFGWNGQRFISEDFFKVRNWFAGYLMDFKFNDKPQDLTKPKYYFGRDLEFVPSFTKDEDVVALQNCLKYLGFFPKNIDSTGWFGAITKDSVKKFQSANGIAPVEGYVGSITRNKLNQLFS